MSGVDDLLRRERGVALVAILLVMLVLSMLAVVFLQSINIETNVSDYSLRKSKSLSIAEAGIAEAISRIRAGDVSDSLNPKMVSQIFLAAAGSLPALGQDSIALATKQPAGAWLAYSTPSTGDGALTVAFKTNAARTAVYRYDPTQNPPVQTTSGNPVYVITATGRSGDAVSRVICEVTRKSGACGVLATVSAHSSTSKLWCGALDHGPFMFNGMNHRLSTPQGAGVWGPDPENYVGSGDIPGFWSTSAITWGGNYPEVCCLPVGSPTGVVYGQPPSQFYTGPWDALLMSKTDFYSMVGTPKKTLPATFSGITYLDDDNSKQNRHGTWTLTNVTGSGLLYVDGDIKISGELNWRGLVYLEGILDLSAPVWILGALVEADPGTVAIQHKRATFLYSSDAVAAVGAGGSVITLSWREL